MKQPNWKKLSQERNFIKMQLAGCYQMLRNLSHSGLLDSLDQKRARAAMVSISPTLKNWDPNFIKKVRIDHERE